MFTVIAYKPNSESIAFGHIVARYESNFGIMQAETKEDIQLKLAEFISVATFGKEPDEDEHKYIIMEDGNIIFDNINGKNTHHGDELYFTALIIANGKIQNMKNKAFELEKEKSEHIAAEKLEAERKQYEELHKKFGQPST